MEAANQGAYEAGGQSIGLHIDIPLEQPSNRCTTLALKFHYFFVRKVMLVKYASAFVLFPGGLGTRDEPLEALKAIHRYAGERDLNQAVAAPSQPMYERTQ